MYKFFEDNKQDAYIFLSESNLKHIKVLRIEKNEQFEVVTPFGKFLCTLEEKKARILQEVTKSTESPINLKLFMGICKSDKMEVILKACTEIGIRDFYPVEMKRSISSYKGKEIKKIKRLEEIALSAAKQSKRDIVPSVHDPIRIEDIKDYYDGKLIIAYELENKNFLENIMPERNVSLVIGPEGGFDQEELDILAQLNPSYISLGDRILRAQTAAIAASFLIIQNWERKFEEI